MTTMIKIPLRQYYITFAADRINKTVIDVRDNKHTIAIEKKVEKTGKKKKLDKQSV